MSTITIKNTPAADNKEPLRDKRAQGIAAMGLVKREGDRFRVTTPSLRGRRASYEVWRDETGKVRCSCLEFEEHANEDAAFRCEHILAVKHSLVAKSPEASTGSPPAQLASPGDAPSQQQAEEPAPANAMSPAQHATSDAAKASPVGFARFEQGENAVQPEETAVSSFPESSSVRSLKDHRSSEEDKVKKQDTAAAAVLSVPEEEVAASHIQDTSTEAEEHTAPIVPLAFVNTLRTLRQPVDPKLIKTREGWTDRQGNTHMVEYVEWHTVADILDRVAATWSHSVRNIVQIGDMVAVTAAITVDGVTREGVGTGTADNETGIKKAEHDALKRAAIKFGIARDLYQRESDVIEKQGGALQAGEFPRDPLAKSMADLITPKQLGMIRALGREAGIQDVDEECQAVLRCKTDELSKRAASSFIDHLKAMQQQEAAVADGMRRAS